MGRLPPTGGPVQARPDPTRGAVEGERREVLGHQHHLAQPAVGAAELVHLGQDGGSVVRDRCLPRNDGMAQKPQLRSHPSATFTYDHGAAVAGRGRFNRSKDGNRCRRRHRPRLADRATPGWPGTGGPTVRRSAGSGPTGQGRPERRHQIHLGQGLGQLVAVALGHAAGHHQPGAVPAGVGQGQDGVHRLLAGRLDEGARVDHHQVGLLGGAGRLVAVGHQRPDQLVGVHLVLRAAQRLDPVPLGHQDNLPGSRPGEAPGPRARRPRAPGRPGGPGRASPAW